MIKIKLFALLTLCCSGCGVAVGEDGSDSPESVKAGRATEALTPDLDPPFQRTIPVSSNVPLVSSETHLCFLSGVQGQFDDASDFGAVSDNAAGMWTARTGSGQSVQATCAGKNFFFAFFGGTERAFFTTQRRAVGGTSCDTNTATMWTGQSATFLSGMEGSFRGGGEAIWIDQAPSAFASSIFNVRDCQADGYPVVGNARSYFVGTAAAGCPAQFWRNEQPFGTPVVGSDVAPYSLTNPGTGGEVFTLMANVSESVCALTKVSGKFSGGCEFAWIDQAGSRWRLRAHACAGRTVIAEARCFSRLQC
jgi:hypothetical protein